MVTAPQPEPIPHERHLSVARSVISEALALASPESFCVAFNGGKDCTAILHLVLEQRPTFKVLFIVPDPSEEFPEVLDFVKETVEEFGLHLIEIVGKPVKEALAELKTTHPEIGFIFMGTRRTDPYAAHLDHRAPTDQGWPQFIRVNPILDWSYADVWKFLNDKKVCFLYEEGYSSLGPKSTTKKNPELNSESGWRHAKTLGNARSERDGR